MSYQTLKSSPLVRSSMAAGIYLMLMWGYIVLPSSQWFAAFLAVMMGIMLVFWVNEAVLDVQTSVDAAGSETPVAKPPSAPSMASEPTLSASYERLDSLKSELKAQYAQFGREQSVLNGKSLGSWKNNQNTGME